MLVSPRSGSVQQLDERDTTSRYSVYRCDASSYLFFKDNALQVSAPLSRMDKRDHTTITALNQRALWGANKPKRLDLPVWSEA